jgi:hypothetical protein
VAVVRDAFGAHDDSQRSLSQEVVALGPHKVGAAPGAGAGFCVFALWRSGVCSHWARAGNLAATHSSRCRLTEEAPRLLAAGCAAVQVAVSSDLMHPHNRLIVDDYELTQDGNYRLRSVGTGGWAAFA